LESVSPHEKVSLEKGVRELFDSEFTIFKRTRRATGWSAGLHCSVISSAIAYLRRPQWTHRRTKILWYHHFAKNLLPHLGHLKDWNLIPEIAKNAIQLNAITNAGIKLPKTQKVTYPVIPTIGI
jgi:hypothetical protein